MCLLARACARVSAERVRERVIYILYPILFSFVLHTPLSWPSISVQEMEVVASAVETSIFQSEALKASRYSALPEPGLEEETRCPELMPPLLLNLPTRDLMEKVILGG